MVGAHMPSRIDAGHGGGRHAPRRRGALVAAWLAGLALVLVAGLAWADGGAGLRAQYDALQDKLRSTPYGLAMYVDSSQTADHISGDLYGVVDYPFADVRAALGGRAQWCDVLFLHLNIKACRVTGSAPAEGLSLQVGGKNDMAGEGNTRVDYRYRVRAAEGDYLEIVLSADDGPFGTKNHRIVMEATSLPNGRTFLHLACSHDYGPVARLAMNAYLRTIARDKVGFSVVDRRADGTPVYVGGVRGVVERNGMRYFLAVIAYLRTLSVPPPQRLERRLDQWFDLTERYPRQLREVSRNQYVAMKLEASSRAP